MTPRGCPTVRTLGRRYLKREEINTVSIYHVAVADWKQESRCRWFRKQCRNSGTHYNNQQCIKSGTHYNNQQCIKSGTHYNNQQCFKSGTHYDNQQCIKSGIHYSNQQCIKSGTHYNNQQCIKCQEHIIITNNVLSQEDNTSINLITISTVHKLVEQRSG